MLVIPYWHAFFVQSSHGLAVVKSKPPSLADKRHNAAVSRRDDCRKRRQGTSLDAPGFMEQKPDIVR